jgi:hypothetical protein
MKFSISLKEEYYNRLSKPYTKRGVKKLFIDQFMSGSGNELKEKFWSPRSSARLCFDLYSWMGEDEGFDDVEFEYKLCCLISGRRRVYANMDVYYACGNEVTFIESKFTETADNRNYMIDLPEAYWKTSREYKSVSGKDVNQEILERYSKREDVMNRFLSFIDDISQQVNMKGAVSWFDAKQETCHLLGIVNYMLDLDLAEGEKVVNFYNVAANFEQDDFAEYFKSRAVEMVGNILTARNLPITFNYCLFSIKDFFEKHGWVDKKTYATDLTVRDLLVSYFPLSFSDPIGQCDNQVQPMQCQL